MDLNWFHNKEEGIQNLWEDNKNNPQFCTNCARIQSEREFFELSVQKEIALLHQQVKDFEEDNHISSQPSNH